MRSNLWDDPRVARLCDLTDQGEAAVIGALYWLWAAADQHTEDGRMPGLTLRQIDRKTGVAGFGKALCEIGWLIDDPQGVVIVNFSEHNGASAKRRSMDAQRKASVRALSASEADSEQTGHGQNAPNCGAREEKRREEITSTSLCSVEVAAQAQPPEVQADAPRRRACRLPDDSPTDADMAWASQERPDLDLRVTRDRYRDHWSAKPGKDGLKLDWPATWRNWVRSERPSTGPPRALRPEKFNASAYVNDPQYRARWDASNRPEPPPPTIDVDARLVD